MLKIMLAEYQKIARTFTKKVSFFAPLVTMLLCVSLGVGELFQSGSYNWWYTMLLPGSLVLICAGVIQKDKKKLKYRNILSLPINPSKTWIAKIGICILLYLISCVIFFIGATIGGIILGSSIPILRSMAGSALLFITFLWQIPLDMFLADRLGTFTAMLISMACNAICITFFSITSIWWIPFAITARLMCPVLRVLPNGLPVPVNDALLSANVVFPGVMITLVLFLFLSILTTLPYQKLEAK